MYSGMGVLTMYVNTKNKDIIYLEKKDKWTVFLHKGKGGTDSIYSDKDKEKALKFIKNYIE